jgi:hypothetical protein
MFWKLTSIFVTKDPVLHHGTISELDRRDHWRICNFICNGVNIFPKKINSMKNKITKIRKFTHIIKILTPSLCYCKMLVHISQNWCSKVKPLIYAHEMPFHFDYNKNKRAAIIHITNKQGFTASSARQYRCSKDICVL